MRGAGWSRSRSSYAGDCRCRNGACPFARSGGTGGRAGWRRRSCTKSLRGLGHISRRTRRAIGTRCGGRAHQRQTGRHVDPYNEGSGLQRHRRSTTFRCAGARLGCSANTRAFRETACTTRTLEEWESCGYPERTGTADGHRILRCDEGRTRQPPPGKTAPSTCEEVLLGVELGGFSVLSSYTSRGGRRLGHQGAPEWA